MVVLSSRSQQLKLYISDQENVFCGDPTIYIHICIFSMQGLI